VRWSWVIRKGESRSSERPVPDPGREVNEIAEKDNQEKGASSSGNADLVARKLHRPHISLT